ncbi:MAG: SMP-30/gluconolactonase/LRE family protein [Acidobacteriota bacterium]
MDSNSRSAYRRGLLNRGFRAAILAALLSPACLAQNVIATIAGSVKTLPDGVLSTSTVAIVPVSAAIAPNSDIYFTEQGSHSVLRLTKGGELRVIAGTGISGYSGDGGPAIAAALAAPAGVAVDAAGNLYIADSENHRIRRVNAQGIIQTVAGTGTLGREGDGGPATSAQLRFPSGIGFDAAGNMFIGDRGNFLIRKIDKAGIMSTYAGTGSRTPSGDGGPALSAGFGFPEFVAVDPAGNLYVSDSAAYRVRKITPNGIITTVAGTGVFGYSGDGGPGTSAAITIPQGIACDSAGNVFFADWLSQRVRRITPGGRIDTVAGTGQSNFSGDGGLATAAGLAAPVGVAIDPTGGFVIADSENARLRRVNAQNLISTIAGSGQAAVPKDGGLAVDAGLSLPFGVAVSSTGIIYVADRGNNRVRRIDTTGKITTAAGTGDIGYSGDGGPGPAARLAYPAGLAVDFGGSLYIADRSNHRIRKVNPQGVISTFAGNGVPGAAGDGGPAATASLLYPTDVAVDASGRVLIADSGNNSIRRVDTNGIISTIAGTGQAGYSGDGGQAVQARFSSPAGVAVDLYGNIIVSDSNNRRVRKIISSGTVTTIAGTGSDGQSVDGTLAVAASLTAPIGVAIDNNGNVFIADRQDVRIRKVNSAGIISTVAGNSYSGFSGDGGISTQARLAFPEGVAVDAAGNVYLTDRNNNRLRAVLANPPTFVASPGAISFSATASGAPTPAAQVTVLPLTGSQTLNAVGLPIRAVARDSWLKIFTDSQGNLPVSLRLSVDPSSLPAGRHQTSLMLTSPATPATREVSVTVDVAPAEAPRMSLNTHLIAISVTEGSEGQSAEIVVNNTGSGSLEFSAAPEDGSSAAWLSIVSGAGTATPTVPGKVNFFVDPKALAPGAYSSEIHVRNASGQDEAVSINLTITAVQNLIVLSQSGFNFTAVAGGGAPLPQVLSLLNTGRGELQWTAEATTLTGGGWLYISRVNGILPKGSADSQALDVVVNNAQLAQGEYYGQILFRSPNAQNSPQTVSVVLSVLAAGTKLPPEIRPSGLIFSGTTSSPPGSQSVYISNLGSAPFSYASGAYTTSGIPWLQHLPLNDSVAPNRPARIVVQPDYRLLDPGIHRGTITFQSADDGSTRTLNVIAVVADGATAPKAGLQAGSCAPSQMKLLLTGSQQNISAAVGQAVPLEVQIIDSCGDPVLPSAPGISVQLSLSNKDQGGPLTHSGGGKWTRTYQPRTVNAAPITATITAFAIGAGGKVIADQADISISVASRAPTPIVGSGGVLNSASFEVDKPVAPGSLVTFKGEQLAAPGPGQIGGGAPLPTRLNGTEVRLAGRPLPLLYAASGQINAQLPFDLPPDTQHHLVVYRDAVLSVPEAISVAAAKPAIFATNQQGFGQGAIVNGITNVLADAFNPVGAGDVITIYCTGLGVVTPAVPEGTVPPALPLSTTVNPVTVSVGGLAAQVLFAGLAPGITGLYQVNAIVPGGVAPGQDVEVIVNAAGQGSSPVTIAVR